MDKLSQRVARDNALDLLTREQLLDYSRLREEEAFLEQEIDELDECRVMLANRIGPAAQLVGEAAILLRKALTLVTETAEDMLVSE